MNPTSRQPTWLLVALGVVTILWGIFGGLSWALITRSLDGEVTRARPFGDEFGLLVMDDGELVVIDRGVMIDAGGSTALKGERVSTAFGSTTLRVGEREVDLLPSREMARMLVALGSVVALAVGRSLLHGRRGSATGGRGRGEHGGVEDRLDIVAEGQSTGGAEL